MALICFSFFRAQKKSRSSAYDSNVSGFFFSGRFSVMTPTLPSDSPLEVLRLAHDRTSTRVLLQLGEQLEQLVLLAARQAGEQLDHPLLVRARHLGEGLARRRGSGGCGRRAGRPASSRRSTRPSFSSWSTMAVTLPPVTISMRESSFIFRPAGMALELRHQVEARQRGAELLAQPRAHLALDQLGAGEQAQPDAQRVVVLGPGDGLPVDAAVVADGGGHVISPSLNRSSLKQSCRARRRLSSCARCSRRRRAASSGRRRGSARRRSTGRGWWRRSRTSS